MRTNRTAAPFVGAAKFKPTRDRRIEVRSVECPSCKAPVGSFCTKVDGTPPTTHVQHPARRRLAIRTMNERAEA